MKRYVITNDDYSITDVIHAEDKEHALRIAKDLYGDECEDEVDIMLVFDRKDLKDFAAKVHNRLKYTVLPVVEKLCPDEIAGEVYGLVKDAEDIILNT